MENLTQILFRSLLLAAMSLFFNTNAKAITLADTIISVTDTNMAVHYEHRFLIKGVPGSVRCEAFYYLLPDTSSSTFSAAFDTTWIDSTMNGKLIKRTWTFPVSLTFWLRLKLTDTATGTFVWAILPMPKVNVLPRPIICKLEWFKKPGHSASDTVDMIVRYKSNVKCVLEGRKGLNSNLMSKASTVSLLADTNWHSLQFIYYGPSGIDLYFDFKLTNAAGSVSISTEKATPIISKTPPPIRQDSVWNNGTSISVSAWTNANNDSTWGYILYGPSKTSLTNRSDSVLITGNGNKKITMLAKTGITYNQTIWYQVVAYNRYGKNFDGPYTYTTATMPSQLGITAGTIWFEANGNNNVDIHGIGTITTPAGGTSRAWMMIADKATDFTSSGADYESAKTTTTENGKQFEFVIANVPAQTWYLSFAANCDKGPVYIISYITPIKVQTWSVGILPISLLTENVKVEVFDILGQPIGVFDFNNKDYSNLPSGQVLLIRYIDSKGTVYAGKVSKGGGAR